MNKIKYIFLNLYSKLTESSVLAIVSSLFCSVKNSIKKVLTPRTIIIVLCIIAIVLIGASVKDYFSSPSKDDEELARLLAESKKLHTEIEVTKTKYSSAVDAIKELSDEKTHLIDLVAELKGKANKPPVIKEVIVYKTKIVPSEPEYITPDLPDEYIYKIGSGLRVARFAKDGKNFRFETSTLNIRTSIVVGEEKSAGLLQIASSAEPEKYYEFPIDDLQVRSTDKKLKLFKPALYLAVRAGFNQKPQLTGGLDLMFLHPKKCIDVLGVSVSGNSQTAQFGVIPFSYNVGCHIPVFENIWIIPDAFVDIHGQFGGGLGIGAKL